MRAELARRKLHEFVRQAWHIVEPGAEFIDGLPVRAVCDHLQAAAERRIRQLLITIPPRHAKSLLTSVFFPVWIWIRNPAERFLFSSYSESLAIRDSVKCRRLIESPWFQARYGHVFRLTSDQNEKRRFDNDHSGVRMSVGVNGSATGEGGSFIVCDDPHSVKDSLSDTVRRAQVDWWFGTMSTRGNDPRTVVRIVIQQRLHESDLAGELIRRGGYCHLNLPAEFEGNRARNSFGWIDPRNEIGELLWPERFTRADIDLLKKDLGSYAASGQLQQRPSPAEGGILKRDWWRYFNTVPDGLTEHLISLDANFNAATDSDFAVAQCWAKRGADVFLLDQIRGRWNFVDLQTGFIEFCRKWPEANAKLVEQAANGFAIIDSLRTRIPGIVGVKPTGSKESRVHAIAPMVEAGNVYLPDPKTHLWVQDLIEEAAAFPNASHDDTVDAMSQALNRMRHKPFQREIVRP